MFKSLLLWIINFHLSIYYQFKYLSDSLRDTTDVNENLKKNLQVFWFIHNT